MIVSGGPAPGPPSCSPAPARARCEPGELRFLYVLGALPAGQIEHPVIGGHHPARLGVPLVARADELAQIVAALLDEENVTLALDPAARGWGPGPLGGGGAGGRRAGGR